MANTLKNTQNTNTNTMGQFYIPRQIEEKLIKSLNLPLITMITGARQVGKSTLLTRLKQYALETYASDDTGFNFENTVFSYTLDDIPLRAQLKKDITYIQKDIELALATSLLHVKKRVFIFIDEIQKFLPLLEWIKQVYDRNSNYVKFVITGSSVTGFTKRLTETLAGRIEFLHLTPITYSELLNYRFNVNFSFYDYLFKQILQGGDNKQSDTSDNTEFDPTLLLDELEKKDDFKIDTQVATGLKTLNKHFGDKIKSIVGTFLEHLFYGGMPKVYGMPVDKRQQVLNNYITVYLEREVGYAARNIDLELFGLSLSSFAKFNGSPINIQEIAKQVGIARPSIYRYLELLEQTFLIKRVYPYPHSGKNKLKSIKLVYLDPGLLNILLNITDIRELASSIYLDKVLLSSIVLNLFAILSNYDLSTKFYYWQDYEEHAVDLVFDLKNVTIAYILDIHDSMDNRKFLNTIKSFAEHAHSKTVLFIKPKWDIKTFSKDFDLYKVNKEVLGDKLSKEKKVFVLNLPAYMLV